MNYFFSKVLAVKYHRITDEINLEYLSEVRKLKQKGGSFGYGQPNQLIAKLKKVPGLKDGSFVFGPTPLLSSLKPAQGQVFDLSQFSKSPPPLGLGVACFLDADAANVFSIAMAYHYGKAEQIVYDTCAALIDTTQSVDLGLKPKAVQSDALYDWDDFFSLAGEVSKVKMTNASVIDLFMGDNLKSILHHESCDLSNIKITGDNIQKFKQTFGVYQEKYHGLDSTNTHAEQYECSSVTQLLMAGFDVALKVKGHQKVVLPKGYYTKYLADVKEFGVVDENIIYYESYEDLVALLKVNGNALVMVCNPSNPPDKSLMTEADRDGLMAVLKEGHFVMEDSAYGDVVLTPDLRKITLQAAASKNECPAPVMNLRTPSKAIGTNGFRAGLAWFNKQDIQANVKQYLEANGTDHAESRCHDSLYAVLNSVYSNHDLIERYLDEYNKELASIKEEINAWIKTKNSQEGKGIPPIDLNTGSFYTFVKLPEGIDCKEHWKSCLKEGVAYVPGHVYGKEGYARLNLNNLEVGHIETVMSVLLA